MRRFPVLLVAAAAAFLPVPPASAHGAPPAEATPANCPPPDLVARYDPDRLSLFVSLPATGCPAREGEFSMSAWIDRTEGQYTEGHGQVVGCGPYPGSAPQANGFDRVQTCELDMSMLHPDPEGAWYDIAVTFPGAAGTETVEGRSFCTSGPDGAYCTEGDAR